MIRADPGAIILVLGALPVRLLLAVRTDLSPDEAYYLASWRLDHQIEDHPPLAPWLSGIADGLTLLPLELRVRWSSLLLGTVCAWLVVELVRQRDGGSIEQRWAAVFGAWFIMPLAGGFLLTPDAALITAALGLVALLPSNPSRSPWRLGAIAGLCLSGMLAKVAMLLVAGAMIVTAARWRDRLAAALGVAAATPMAVPSLLFQSDHAFRSTGPGLHVLAALLAAMGAQLALWGPAIVWPGLPGLVDHRLLRNVVVALTAAVALSTAIRAIPPEPNWFAPAAILIVTAASLRFAQAPRWLRITTVVIGPVGAFLLSTHVIHPWIPIPTESDPSARLHGWRDGNGSSEAPGVGAYGADAEACIYQGECENLIDYWDDRTAHLK